MQLVAGASYYRGTVNAMCLVRGVSGTCSSFFLSLEEEDGFSSLVGAKVCMLLVSGAGPVPRRASWGTGAGARPLVPWQWESKRGPWAWPESLRERRGCLGSRSRRRVADAAAGTRERLGRSTLVRGAEDGGGGIDFCDSARRSR